MFVRASYVEPGKVYLIFEKFFPEKVLYLSVFQQRTEAVAQRCFFKKGILRNFAKFTGKHLCQSLFFNKVAGLAPVTSLKRDSGIGVFL